MNGMPGSFQMMKSLNKSLILNIIRTNEPISRAEIAKKAQLTPPTVTNIVSELLTSKLVIESDLGTSNGGRKPILLRINSSAFHVIGIDVGVGHMKAIATRLDAKIIAKLDIKMPVKLTNETFLTLLKQSVHGLIKKVKLQPETIIGIGIGMHGLVDPIRGESLFAPNLTLRNIPIKKELEQEFDISVEVENDVRVMALSESWFGQGVDIENFICLNVGIGIGAGLVLDNKLYKGSSHTAGEIGHTTIDPEGPKCSCGNDGCLQALASGPAIAARAKKSIQMGKESSIKTLCDGNLEQVTGEMVYEAALQQDELAIEILQNTGRYLGIAIANIINIINPSRVIIGGGVSKSGEFILDSLKQTVEQRALDTPSKATDIVITKLGDYVTAIGAVTLVLQKLFNPEYAN